MASVTIGLLTVTEGTGEAEWGYAPEPEQSGRPTLFTDATAASAAFGGPIKQPAVFPDGFALSGIEVHSLDSLRIAVSVYRRVDGSSFQIEQAGLADVASPSQQEEMIVPPSGLRPVNLRSLRAAAWTLELPPPLLRARPMRLAHLMWEEDGKRFLATATCLDEDDLISVAQSL